MKFLLIFPGVPASPNPHDLSTPASRSKAFLDRTATLTEAKEKGGAGLAFNVAIEAMKSDPNDAKLLEAMGGPAAVNVVPADAPDHTKMDPSIRPDRTPGLYHLWSAEARAEKFRELIEHYTADPAKGGKGLSMEQALTAMRAHKSDNALLLAMGDGPLPAR